MNSKIIPAAIPATLLIATIAFATSANAARTQRISYKISNSYCVADLDLFP